MSKSRNIADIGSNDVLDTNANGIDVTGTVTADGILSQDGTSGATASTNADQLVIDSSTRGGLSILTPNNTLGEIYFGDPENNNIGRIWYDHSSNSMSFRTNAAERMRIDSSGNLLVATTDNTLYNNTTGGGANILSDGLTTIARETAATSDTVLVLNDTGAGGSIQQFRKDGSEVGAIGVDTFDNLEVEATRELKLTQNRNQGRTLVWTDVGGTDSVLYSVNDNNTDLGQSGQRFKDLYLSGGVYLGGTTSANFLDDYEEGTWTPYIVGGLSSGTGTYSGQRGRYTKVGQLVMLQIEIGLSSHTGTGDIRILGIPFIPLNDVTQRSAGALFTNNMTYRSGYTSGQAVFYIGTSNYIEMYMSASGTGWNPQRLDDDSSFNVIGTVYYSTAQ